MFKTVTAKLGNMRKPQSFVVQLSDKGNFVVQSDKSIGQFDMNTGKGVLNTKGSYFHHLTAFLGAVPYQFPEDFVKQCHAAFALKGDLLGSSEITGPIYYGGMTEIGYKPAVKIAQQDPDNDYVSNPTDDANVYPFDTIVHEQSEDDYEVAVLDRLCYKLPASEKMHIMNSEMDLPVHATRDEAFIVANYIAGACGYTARRIDDDQIQTWVDGKRYLLTWDNGRRLFVSWQRDDQ